MTISPSETAVATRASCSLNATDARSTHEEPPSAPGAAPASAWQTFAAASTDPADPPSFVPASTSAGTEASTDAPAAPLQQIWREQKAWASPVTRVSVVVVVVDEVPFPESQPTSGPKRGRARAKGVIQ